MTIGADDATAEILDSHCHAWRRWPYSPLVPDESTRGSIEQLLYEMNLNGVAEALVICASIEGNDDNVDYVRSAQERHFGRLHLVADIDCTWSPTFRTPGSGDRLRALDDRSNLSGCTLYAPLLNDGWLKGAEADGLFRAAQERGLFVSISITPSWQADLRGLARRYPDVLILCHHLGDLQTTNGCESDDVQEVVASASVANILIKVSGFHYCSAAGWNSPWDDAIAIFHRLYDAFGPDRMCWGSDFPASKRYCTYRQSLEVIKSNCDFLTSDDRRKILGASLRRVLDHANVRGAET